MRTDLLLHALAGYFIASLCQYFGAWMLIAALIAGLLKELNDIKRTGFDYKDLILTVVGGFSAWWIELIK